MSKSKVLVGFVIVLYVLFVISEFSGNHSMSFYFDCLIVPVIALTYLLLSRRKNRYFSLFLLFYTFANIYIIIISLIPPKEGLIIFDYEYLFVNSMFVIAYIFLLIKILKSISLKYILKNFKMHLLVLIILNSYLVYVLQVIVKPNIVLSVNYYFELVYNIVTLLLLAIALLNYFYKDNQKALYLFLGVLCLVFSEVIDIAFIYISEKSILNFLATTLSLGAFYFLYQQSKFLNKSREEESYTS